jgi:YVTN family beta-propeller protein
VATTHPGRVTRIDAGSLQAGEPVATGGDSPVQLSLGNRGLWVTDEDAATAALLDPDSLRPIVRTIAVGDNPRDILERFGHAWVVATDDDRVQRIAPGRRKAVKVGDEPHHIAATPDALWVTSAKAGTVSRIDPRTAEVTDTVETGGTPLGIAYGSGALWVSDFGSNVVYRIDPGS